MWATSNPFNPNGIVPSNLFAGRASYCLKILQKLSETRQGRPSSFFLYGERGIGKSALAKLLGTVAANHNPDLYDLGFLTSYYSASPNQPFQSVIEASLNSLTDSMPASWLELLGARLGNLFKNGKFTLGAFGGTVSIEQSKGTSRDQITLKDQAVSIFANIVSTLKEATEGDEKRDGVLVIIDEMQNVSDIEIAASSLRGILNTLDFKSLGHVSFLLIGLDQAFDGFMTGDVSALRAFDPIHLDVMPSDEAMEVLRKGFKEVGLKWDEKVLESSIPVAGGYPHSIQVVGHNLVHVDNDGMIDQTDWKLATDRTANELREKDFSAMYSFGSRKTGREKILDVIALLGSLTRKQLIEACRQGCDLQNAYQYLAELEKKGAIKVLSNGKIELHSQLFRTAILSVLFPNLDPNSPLWGLWFSHIIEEVSSD